MPEGTILFVSTLWPYKNAEVAIRALSPGCATGAERTLRWRDADSGLRGEARELAYDEGVADAVLFLGHVPQARMRGVYARAAALVYPSLEECFGLPAIEAMAAGVPVVAADWSSLPEIVQDAGLLVPPTDAEAVARALDRVLTDESLRRTLIERGHARAAEFTWERTARRDGRRIPRRPRV